MKEIPWQWETGGHEPLAIFFILKVVIAHAILKIKKKYILTSPASP
jgi:hypothetical protein